MDYGIRYGKSHRNQREFYFGNRLQIRGRTSSPELEHVATFMGAWMRPNARGLVTIVDGGNYHLMLPVRWDPKRREVYARPGTVIEPIPQIVDWAQRTAGKFIAYDERQLTKDDAISQLKAKFVREQLNLHSGTPILQFRLYAVDPMGLREACYSNRKSFSKIKQTFETAWTHSQDTAP